MKLLKPAASLLLFFTLVTGLLYPWTVTALARILFPAQAQGSLIADQGRVVGSRFIGQPFSEDRYFWGRPSATSLRPYDAGASSGSNLGPTNPALWDLIRARRRALMAAHPGKGEPPGDLLTASASGLDPEISRAAADYQVDRVAAARGLDPVALRALVAVRVRTPLFRLFGSERLNVLELNLAIDARDVSN